MLEALRFLEPISFVGLWTADSAFVDIKHQQQICRSGRQQMSSDKQLHW